MSARILYVGEFASYGSDAHFFEGAKKRGEQQKPMAETVELLIRSHADNADRIARQQVFSQVNQQEGAL